MFSRLRVLIVTMALTLSAVIPAITIHVDLRSSSAAERSLVVVGDENYPPFEFLINKGQPHGVFVDIWRLWSNKTGVPVHYRLMKWADALKAVEDGRADVVGGIFHSRERARTLDFSPSYHEIPADIFFHRDIYGLRGPEDLRGFRVGVSEGDFAIEFIRKRHPVLDLLVFPDNRAMVQGALNGQVKVFVGDRPVVHFYLAQDERAGEFRQAERPLYTAKVFAAVKKGRLDLLEEITAGFEKINEEDLRAIVNQWAGTRTWDKLPWNWIALGLALAVLALLLMGVWNRELTNRIQKATAQLVAKQEALKESEAKLRDSEEAFRHFTELSRDCIMRFDRGLRHLYVNKVAEETTGIPMAEFLGKTHDQLGFPAELVELWHGLLEEVFRTGQPNQAEFRLPSGIWVDWLLFPEMDRDGHVKAVMTSARDITERKINEERIRDLSQFQQSVIENANIWITVFDRTGKVLLWNEAARVISGFEMGQVASRDDMWSELLNSRGAWGNMEELIQAVMANGGSMEDLESLVNTGDQGPRTITWILRVMLDKEDRPSGLIALGRDITDKMRLEERLRQSQKMEAVGTLASGVAHDFNNLLQVIGGNVQLLMLRCPTADMSHEYLMEISGSVEKAAALVRRLLTFSRELAVKPRRIDLNRLIEQNRRFLARTIPKMITIETALPPDLRPIMADYAQIEQVILNLATNARDAMPTGGRLLFETANVEKEGPDGVNRFVRLRVSDNGLGMDKKTLEHAFDPFFTTKEVGKGTGLGLSMAYGIIGDHGGTMTCDSRPEKGTVFTIDLPANGDTIEEADNRRSSFTPSHSGRETLLLVDDEPSVRNAAREYLVLHDYTIMTAASGEEALETYRRHRTELDLVVMDLGMPGMGGSRAMEELLKQNPACRILIASGYSDQKQVRDSLKNGASGFIAKPYGMNDLLVKIRRILAS